MTTNTNAALVEYANPLNWDVDENGIRRVWKEPGSETPEAYNGFELAKAALSTAAHLTTGWPRASISDSCKGWTLDYKFLDKVEQIARNRTEYSTSMEATEQVLIAALEVLAVAPKAEPAQPPAAPQEELREDASYESMNLAVMVLSDCGHSSNYKPLLERVAGRIDRHMERLLTAQRADLTRLAQAEPVLHPEHQAKGAT